MSLIERKYITRGSTTNGTSGTAYGFSSGTVPAGPGATAFGTAHDFSSGSDNNVNIDEFFNTADLENLFYDDDTDKLYFYADAGSTNIPENPGRGWDTLTIGSTVFNRTDATFTTNSLGPYALWRWDNITSNPFSSGINTVDWRNLSTNPVNLSITTVNSNSTTTQNVTSPSQDIVVTASFTLGLTYVTHNCEIKFIAGSTGGSFSSTTQIANIRFTDPGPYHAIFYQSYQNNAAVISGTVSGQQTHEGYGLVVNDASAKERIAINTRAPRHVYHISGTGSGSDINLSASGYNSPLGEWLAFNTLSGSNYSVDPTNTTVNQIRLQRADVRTSNASFQVLSGSEDYRIIVMRF